MSSYALQVNHGVGEQIQPPVVYLITLRGPTRFSTFPHMEFSIIKIQRKGYNNLWKIIMKTNFHYRNCPFQ